MPSIPKFAKILTRKAVDMKGWVAENPKTTAVIALAPVVGAVATPVALGAVGFTSTGVAGGKSPAHHC